MLDVKNGLKLNIKPFSLYKNNYMIKMTQLQSFSLKVKFAFQKPTNLKGIYCYGTFRRALAGPEQQLGHEMAEVAGEPGGRRSMQTRKNKT